MTAPTVKLFDVSDTIAVIGHLTDKTSAMKRESRRPSLSASVPRMADPKIAPIVQPAVIISCSPLVSGCPRSLPTCGSATPITAVS